MIRFTHFHTSSPPKIFCMPFGNFMITFLVINTSGLTLIPTTIISLRMMYGSSEPTKIVFACIISTVVATVGGILMDRLLARRYRD